MWTRNNNVLNQNMLKHFIYLSSSKLTTSSLCSLYYKYSSKLSSFFCILSFLVRAISIDQTFYSTMHYLAAVWLDSRHDLNKFFKWLLWISLLHNICASLISLNSSRISSLIMMNIFTFCDDFNIDCNRIASISRNAIVSLT